MSGTTPEGTHSPEEAAGWVRVMFGRVARRYDLANHLLSFNIDRIWRARTVRRVRPILDRPGARALDICCGTGDLMLALEEGAGGQGSGAGGRGGAQRRAFVYGSDFCHPMLTAARRKVLQRGRPALLFEADALRLPVADQSFDVITVAFGFRNLVDYEAGLVEMRRVLRPGGVAAILEFSQPPNPIFRAVYNFYSRRILPPIGGAISGSRDAYEYLPESVRKFPNAAELADGMRRTGFREVRYEYFTGGIVALHLGVT